MCVGLVPSCRKYWLCGRWSRMDPCEIIGRVISWQIQQLKLSPRWQWSYRGSCRRTLSMAVANSVCIPWISHRTDVSEFDLLAGGCCSKSVLSDPLACGSHRNAHGLLLGLRACLPSCCSLDTLYILWLTTPQNLNPVMGRWKKNKYRVQVLKMFICTCLECQSYLQFLDCLQWP